MSLALLPQKCPTHFLLVADFGNPPLTGVLALQSALMWPTRPKTKTFFVGVALPPTFGVVFNRTMPKLGEHTLAVSDFRTVQFSSFTFRKLITHGIVIACHLIQVSITIGTGPRVRLLMAVAMCAIICA